MKIFNLPYTLPSRQQMGFEVIRDTDGDWILQCIGAEAPLTLMRETASMEEIDKMLYGFYMYELHIQIDLLRKSLNGILAAAHTSETKELAEKAIESVDRHKPQSSKA